MIEMIAERIPVKERVPAEIPAVAGIGLRAPHYREFLSERPAIGWIEVHSENLFAAGGSVHHIMERVRQDVPISLHGVGLSLASADPLNQLHLRRLAQIIERYEPGLVSEHLCWVSADKRYLHDLLPIPYTDELLDHLVPRIIQVQDFLGRQILIENVSAYLQFDLPQLSEWAFLNALVERSGCGLLLDVNNLYVNGQNQSLDVQDYLVNLRRDAVQEIHLAGFTKERVEDCEVLIDTHSRPVWSPVWSLYRESLHLLARRVPTLIEWDSEIPALAVLINEAKQAQCCLESVHV